MLISYRFLFLTLLALVPVRAAWAAGTEPKEAAIPTAENAPPARTEVKQGMSGNYLSSQFARSSGDIDSAAKYLETVYKNDPHNVDVANQLMGLYLLKGQLDKAMGVADKIGKESGQEPIAALMLSLQAIKNKDMDKASKILDEAFENEGGQLWLPLVSGWLDIERGKMAKPLTLEELSTEVGSAAPIVNYHLALINARAGFTEAAAENFKAAIPDPEHPPARVMQLLLQFYEKNKQPESLKPLVTSYLEAHPEAGATKDPIRMESVQDGVAEVLLTMGTIMYSAEAAQDATLYFQLALYLKPDMIEASMALAEAYDNLKQYGIANQLLAKIAPADTLYMNARILMAMNMARMNKWPEAMAQLDALIKDHPKELRIYIAKGDLLRLREKFGEAIAVYDAAIAAQGEVKTTHWPVYFARGTSYERLGNWPAAEKDLRKAIELSPNQPDVLNYLGYGMLTRGEKLEEARDLIEASSKTRPNDPQIADSMGWALYLLGDYDKSVDYLEKAVALLPADATVNSHLGDVYYRLGRKTEARFQWERALGFSPEETLLAELHKKLKDGLPIEPAVNKAEHSQPKATAVE